MLDNNSATIKIRNPAETQRNGHGSMIALKRIENYSYYLSDEIGLGFTSHVYKGKCDLDNKPVAVKVIELKNTEDELQKLFLNEEIAVLEQIKEIDSTNLLKLEKVIKTKNNLYIITELCEGKDLAKILRKKKKFTEVEAQSIMRQLLIGYQELYNLGIVHRDLKLANLFITKGLVKIADFGFAINEKKCYIKMNYNVGSPYYMPPEALKDNRYSYLSDVWGIGVIAYQLIYGRVPWKDKEDHVIYNMIMNCPVEKLFDDHIALSDHYKDFIKACLTIDTTRRAKPEFMISYSWPLAQTHIEGLEDIDRKLSISKPNVDNKNQLVFLRHNESADKISLQKKKSVELKRRSPSLGKKMGDNQRIHPLKHPPIPLKKTESKEGGPEQKTGEAQLTENALLGQIHYCRFMFQLYLLLKSVQIRSERTEFLLSELISKISSKMKLLSTVVKSQQNLLQCPGFNNYVNTSNWQNLKKIILQYDDKYSSAFKHERVKAEELINFGKGDRVLQDLANSLKQTLPTNLELLEKIVYYFQIRQIEAQQKFHDFYNKSKIEYLAQNRNGYQQMTAEKKEQITDRLLFKLHILGI